MFDSVIQSIEHRISEAYKTFLEKALEPYGINRQNIAETANRVFIISHQSVGALYQTIEDFYIDERYVFTIKKTLRCKERATGDISMITDLEIVKGESHEYNA